MAKKLLIAPTGKLLFEDPGDLLYGEDGGGGSLVCPDCSSGCVATYSSTIPNLTGTCGGACSSIVGQTLSQVGSTCQWTATQGGWTHEMPCEDGIWYYRIWTGGVGGTLCAEWTEVDETEVSACPPVGGTSDGTWVRTGGDCVGDDFDLGAQCPSNCTNCEDLYSIAFSTTTPGTICGSGPDITVYCSAYVGTICSKKAGTGCQWDITFACTNCTNTSPGTHPPGYARIFCSGDIWTVDIRSVTAGLCPHTFTAPNVDGCPPATGWVQQTGACTASITLSAIGDCET